MPSVNTVLEMENYEKDGKMHPKKFSLMLLIVGMCMLFAALTSAFIVRQAEGNWLEFALPAQFWYSTIGIVASSLTMILALRAARKDQITMSRIYLFVTFILGMSFVYFQIDGFYEMASRGIYFSPPKGSEGGLVSGSFIIALVALHLLHLLGGILFLLVVLIKSLMLRVHKKNLLSINLCNTYW
ncbi:MAG: cytochrome c oxidase subunit 3, partial [Bacteroidia bacterium]